MHLRQCNIDRLEEEALAVSELDSPRYGQHLSAAEVCRMSSCPGRAEGVRGVLEWVLDAAEALPEGFRWEEGKWLTPEEGRDDVMVKVRACDFSSSSWLQVVLRSEQQQCSHCYSPIGQKRCQFCGTESHPNSPPLSLLSRSCFSQIVLRICFKLVRHENQLHRARADAPVPYYHTAAHRHQFDMNTVRPSDQVLCSHVVVSMSAAAAADTFPEAAFRPHRRTRAHTRTPGGDGSPLTGSTSGGGGGGKEKTNAAILRATGDVLVPLTLAPHVEFVSGLTELWVPDARHGKVDRAGTGRFGGLSGGNQVGLGCRSVISRFVECVAYLCVLGCACNRNPT